MERLIDAFRHEDALKHDPGAGVFGGAFSDLLDISGEHAEGAERNRVIHSILKRRIQPRGPSDHEHQ